MGFLLLKVIFNDKIDNCNSVVGVCNKLSSEEIFRSFINESEQPVMQANFYLSDAMPYIANEYFIPRPAAIIRGLKELNITHQKALRTINFIQLSKMDEYFDGTYDYLEATKDNFGIFMRSPVGASYHFNNDAGIYFLMRCDSIQIRDSFISFVSNYMNNRFNVRIKICAEPVSDSFLSQINEKNSKYRVLLSTLSTDIEEEILNEICRTGSYIISEKKLFNDSHKICYIRPGAVILRDGLYMYNDKHRLGCISISCKEG